MEEEYQVDVVCYNCKKKNFNVKIPKGMTIEEFGKEKNVICRNCGCNAIRVKNEK